MREQLSVVPSKPDAGKGVLNWTLVAPNGRVMRGVYSVTEAQWLQLVKGLEATRTEDQ